MIWTTIAAAGISALLPGTYTNEEQVYFAGEAGKPAPVWTGLRIDAEGDQYRLQPIDAFGQLSGKSQSIPASCFQTYRNDDDAYVRSRTVCANIMVIRPTGLTLNAQSGDILLDRARPVTCWAAIRKRKNKADGGEDWYFARDIRLHDAGGRALVKSDESPPQSLVLRMRDVAWSSGPNRPSLVLYVHTEDPARAVSYAWADPDASRVGINLRWMQASCTRDEN